MSVRSRPRQPHQQQQRDQPPSPQQQLHQSAKGSSSRRSSLPSVAAQQQPMLRPVRAEDDEKSNRWNGISRRILASSSPQPHLDDDHGEDEFQYCIDATTKVTPEGALQFLVPPMNRATTTDRQQKERQVRMSSAAMTTTSSAAVLATEASWDALLRLDKEQDEQKIQRQDGEEEGMSRKMCTFPSKAAVGATTSVSKKRMARIKSLFGGGGGNSANSKVVNTSRDVRASKTAETNAAAGHGGGSAAAAVVFRTPSEQPKPLHHPQSLRCSSSSDSSTAYVGWPGTQDRSGQKIAMSDEADTTMSYDDGTALFHSNDAEKEKEKLQQQNTSRYTAQTSIMTRSDDTVLLFSSVERTSDDEGDRYFPSPIRAAMHGGNRRLPLEEPRTPTNAAEFHLAAAVADSRAAAAATDLQQQTTNNSYMQQTRSPEEGEDEKMRLLRLQLSPGAEAVRFGRSLSSVAAMTSRATRRDGGAVSRYNDDDDDDGHSKTSSAYLSAVENTLHYPELRHPDSAVTRSSSDYNHHHRNRNLPQFALDNVRRSSKFGLEPAHDDAVRAVSQVLRRQSDGDGRGSDKKSAGIITERALQRNEALVPPHRNYATPATKGFRGLIEKTQAVPSLMDNDDSDSLSSSRATSLSGSNNNNNQNNASKNIFSTARIQTPARYHPENKLGGYTATAAEARSRRGACYDRDDSVTESDVFDGISVSNESDVFDNLSKGGRGEHLRSSLLRSKARTRGISSYPERIAEEVDTSFDSPQQQSKGEFNLVLLGGGLTAIQTTPEDFLNRRTASDFDGNLTNSDISSNGYTRIPGYHEMLSAGTRRDSSLHGIHGNLGVRPRAAQTATYHHRELDHHDEGSCSSGSRSNQSEPTYNSGRSSLFSDPYRSESGGRLQVHGDLSQYYVHPSQMKQVLRHYRKFSQRNAPHLGFAEYEKEEDERKTFALFEMRARIMEKDIERGLERRGGTVVVDDLVTTAYNRTAQRVRDAVIVSKAWRDGATISDVINTALLTRRANHTYFIKRPVFSSAVSRFSQFSTASARRFTWEAVRWSDDTDMLQYRCPSLGSRHMRGFEMFTVGDCQSILLKLTNGRCMVRTRCRDTHYPLRFLDVSNLTFIPGFVRRVECSDGVSDHGRRGHEERRREF
jgi:hypothetical protein